MHSAVFNGSVNDTKAAKLEAMVVEMEERKRERKSERSCDFLAPLARTLDNFDPISFKRTNISTKSENCGSSEKWEGCRLRVAKIRDRNQDEILRKCKRKEEREREEDEYKIEPKGKMWNVERTGEKDITNSSEPTVYMYIYQRDLTY